MVERERGREGRRERVCMCEREREREREREKDTQRERERADKIIRKCSATIIIIVYLCCEATCGGCRYIIRDEDVVNCMLLNSPWFVKPIVTEFLDVNIT